MKQEIPIQHPAALSESETRALRLVAASMIPADAVRHRGGAWGKSLNSKQLVFRTLAQLG